MKRCLSCQFAFEASGWNCPRCGSSPALLKGFPSFAPALAQAHDGWDPGHARGLAELEPHCYWFRARNRLILWLLQRHFPSARSYLEVGCGTGYVLSGVGNAFPRMETSGTDALCEGLEFARRRCPQAVLLQADARSLPFKEEFDVVGAFDILEHVEDDDQALREIHQVLRPGGGLVLTVPQHPFLWSAMDEVGRHKRRYLRRGLVDKLRKAGFENILWGSFVSLLLPAMVMSRLLMPRNPKDLDPLVEVRQGLVANFLLEKILSVELFLLKRGLRLPAGGTLYAVANRPDKA